MLVTTPWLPAPDHSAKLQYSGARAGTHITEFCGVRAAYRIGEDGLLKWVVPLGCDHAGGELFMSPRDARVWRCPRHGWEVNLDTDAPPVYANGLPKAQLLFESTGLEAAHVFVPAKTLNWKDLYTAQYKPTPAPVVTWLNHACLHIEIAGARILTDPWLCGPAFHNGWWLKYPTPVQARALAETAEYIYISHEHPDHLSPLSLRKFGLLHKKYIVPLFKHAPQPDRVAQRLLAAGVPADNILRMEVAPGAPTQFALNDNGLWAGMLCSSNQNLDSGLFIAHGETGLLLASDAAQLNNMVLPNDITFLATAFAGGASAFPTCFTEYDDHAVQRVVQARAAAMRDHVYSYVRAAEPLYYMPYAGFFTEDPTVDPDVYYRNKKLDIELAMSSAVKGGAQTLAPFDWQDPALLRYTLEPKGKVTVQRTAYAAPAGEFRDLYRSRLHADARLDWDAQALARYFLSSGYKGDFLLYITGVGDFAPEVSIPFDLTLFVDYKTGGHGFIATRAVAGAFAEAEANRPCMHITVRAREAMLNAVEGRPLDELFIGFNVRVKERGGYQAAWFKAMCTSMQPANAKEKSWI